jgi:hypothetical protein
LTDIKKKMRHPRSGSARRNTGAVGAASGFGRANDFWRKGGIKKPLLR